MNNALLKLFVKIQIAAMNEEGQDLIEYALVASLISLAAVATIGPIGTKIAAIFTNINTQLGTA
jgi:pilus assembly protein Flp/PilA